MAPERSNAAGPDTETSVQKGRSRQTNDADTVARNAYGAICGSRCRTRSAYKHQDTCRKSEKEVAQGHCFCFVCHFKFDDKLNYACREDEHTIRGQRVEGQTETQRQRDVSSKHAPSNKTTVTSWKMRRIKDADLCSCLQHENESNGLSLYCSPLSRVLGDLAFIASDPITVNGPNNNVLSVYTVQLADATQPLR
ncbi:hypothetical protein F2P81_003474 [Scophthalmus maximus]|uniref:Uncharacterized protein n=1 Tax=Scophthalmus maximus TaxID=52904 RepID=A0A6A4T9Q3_SCOMX|nr:hypothetical protein F2P81_003474 [Scophthalmus maximus]